MIIEFSIPYVPGPKQSTRFNRLAKKLCCSDPKVVRDAESLASLLIPHRPTQPIDCAVSLSLVITYPWLKKHNRIRKTLRTPKTTRPDCDQLAKQVLDVMQRTGFFTDDARVFSLRIEKFHGHNGPCLYVKMETDE